MYAAWSVFFFFFVVGRAREESKRLLCTFVVVFKKCQVDSCVGHHVHDSSVTTFIDQPVAGSLSALPFSNGSAHWEPE